ncbi:MAG: hypothetical protein RRY29_10435 [Desulfovibrionaceae bacterium]
MTFPYAPYTAEVLQWQLGQKTPMPAPAEDDARARRTADRVVRTVMRAGHRHVLVLGLGDGTLARLLARALPATCMLLILETQPALARQVLSRWPDLQPMLMVDSSPWALLMLCQAVGISREHCLICRPSGADMQTPCLPVGLEQWRRLFLGARLRQVATGAPKGVPSLSVACIAHPEENMLTEFFAHIPPWVAELVVVWDGAAPARVPPCSVPLRQKIRPLAGNFSAQRNAMLDLCQGDWCLYLDVDETLKAETWAAIPAWMSVHVEEESTRPHVGAIMLPRLTFMQDMRHARMGYGLWPDVQVRLFPLRAGLRFHGAVHERLTGVQGCHALAGGHALLHYSHVRKDKASLSARLQVFDRAGHARHILSTAYPVLPVDYFQDLGQAFGANSLLCLPDLI